MDGVEPEVDPRYLPENEVFSITLFKQEPECLNYAYKVVTEFNSDHAEHLEQLQLVKHLIDQMVENSEKQNLGRWMEMSRMGRREIAAEREAKAKEAPPPETVH